MEFHRSWFRASTCLCMTLTVPHFIPSSNSLVLLVSVKWGVQWFSRKHSYHIAILESSKITVFFFFFLRKKKILSHRSHRCKDIQPVTAVCNLLGDDSVCWWAFAFWTARHFITNQKVHEVCHGVRTRCIWIVSRAAACRGGGCARASTWSLMLVGIPSKNLYWKITMDREVKEFIQGVLCVLAPGIHLSLHASGIEAPVLEMWKYMKQVNKHKYWICHILLNAYYSSNVWSGMAFNGWVMWVPINTQLFICWKLSFRHAYNSSNLVMRPRHSNKWLVANRVWSAQVPEEGYSCVAHLSSTSMLEQYASCVTTEHSWHNL